MGHVCLAVVHRAPVVVVGSSARVQTAWAQPSKTLGDAGAAEMKAVTPWYQ